MAGVTGLGGVFIQLSSDVKKRLQWYHDVLGVDVSAYGVNFLKPNEFTLLTFTDAEEQSVILNFTVDHLEAFVHDLRKKDVKFLTEIEEFDYGKFVRIEDVDGYPVELWEPYHENYAEMVETEIRAYVAGQLRKNVRED
ncbi:hypothetical protein QT711_07305 [Sporosarcina saromensis]|uniref:VOC domain-containing protein n=1 Tax=Sporosarcina saromensis TaxID=359365 RepID=A0ABU4G9I3_9BACL|nr:VOC family protein [Sporosarcina saromensis]MDW0112988.1 hypothetical protein [Sporosarcina saromensis]